MNDESLSALLDGECSPSELDTVLQDLERNPESRRRLSRQILAREARRGVAVRKADLDFADRVMAGLDALPAEAASAKVVSMAPRSGAGFPWRPALGLAAAAAFGAVAVLVLRPAATPVPETAPTVAAVSPAVESEAAAPEQADWSSLDEQKRQQLRNYLIAYSQSRAQQGMSGTLGYARYAAYTDYHAQDSGN